jgi:hypothetical protein
MRLNQESTMNLPQQASVDGEGVAKRRRSVNAARGVAALAVVLAGIVIAVLSATAGQVSNSFASASIEMTESPPAEAAAVPPVPQTTVPDVPAEQEVFNTHGG